MFLAVQELLELLGIVLQLGCTCCVFRNYKIINFVIIFYFSSISHTTQSFLRCNWTRTSVYYHNVATELSIELRIDPAGFTNFSMCFLKILCIGFSKFCINYISILPVCLVTTSLLSSCSDNVTLFAINLEEHREETCT